VPVGAMVQHGTDLIDGIGFGAGHKLDVRQTELVKPAVVGETQVAPQQHALGQTRDCPLSEGLVMRQAVFFVPDLAGQLRGGTDQSGDPSGQHRTCAVTQQTHPINRGSRVVPEETCHIW
jgi:hypothetical protein